MRNEDGVVFASTRRIIIYIGNYDGDKCILHKDHYRFYSRRTRIYHSIQWSHKIHIMQNGMQESRRVVLKSSNRAEWRFRVGCLDANDLSCLVTRVIALSRDVKEANLHIKRLIYHIVKEERPASLVSLFCRAIVSPRV